MAIHLILVASSFTAIPPQTGIRALSPNIIHSLLERVRSPNGNWNSCRSYLNGIYTDIFCIIYSISTTLFRKPSVLKSPKMFLFGPYIFKADFHQLFPFAKGSSLIKQLIPLRLMKVVLKSLGKFSPEQLRKRFHSLMKVNMGFLQIKLSTMETFCDVMLHLF